MEKTLNELINELCPDGVEYIELKSVANIGTGKSDKKDAVINGDYPFYVRSATVARKNSYEYDDCSIIIPGEGGVGDIFHITNGKYALHQRAYRIHFHNGSGVNVKFAYHYMRSAFKSFIQTKAVSATVVSIRKPMIEKFTIPVPPLPVQEEIVRILDAMSTLTATLTAEKGARKKQYEYYRDALLTFGEDVDVKSLKTVCKEISIGKFLHKQYQSPKFSYPVYNGGVTETGHSDSYNKDGDYIIISARGSAGHVTRHSGKYWAGNSCYSIAPHDNIAHIRFLYYVLKNQETYLKEQALKSSLPAISKKQVEELLIPVPPLHVQKEIASILDKLSDLAEGVDIGLPREIELAQKQYEYYLAKLLDFPEA